jgi:ferredoxin-nitrite reductase/sulfite reductase (ferredoxin)
VQLYGVDRSRIPALLRRFAGVGLTTREASGNVVRNITLCPWAGVAPDEPFDITPYAQAASDYLLRNPLTQLLPRKVKVAFEGCATDHARTVIHDMGIVAALNGGRIGFRVYVGGGLGPAPRAAQLLEPWTSEALLLPTVEAILRVFERFGERRDRARARLKFLVEQLGWEEFRKRVLEERPIIWATQSGYALTALRVCPTPQPRLNATPIVPVDGAESTAVDRWLETNATTQRQAGFACVIMRVPYGDITGVQLRHIARLAREHANGIRLTNEQNIMLRGVRLRACAVLYVALQRLGLAEPGRGRLVDVTRCPGADSCLSAITRPLGLAQSIEALCHNGLADAAEAPITIKISGCPNSCGHHLIAGLGFFGVAVKVGDRHLPCYQILVGGRAEEGSATFGERLLRIPAQRTPEAVKRIVQFYHHQRRPDEGFAAFVERVGLKPLRQLLEDLADLTGADRIPELFVDLGASEPFKPEAGKGECAA